MIVREDSMSKESLHKEEDSALDDIDLPMTVADNGRTIINRNREQAEAAALGIMDMTERAGVNGSNQMDTTPIVQNDFTSNKETAMESSTDGVMNTIDGDGDGDGGLPAAPPTQPQPTPCRAGLDGLELADAAEVLREGERRGVAPREVSLHGGGEDDRDLGGDHRVALRGIRDRRPEDRQSQAVLPLALKGPLPRQGLVQADPEGPHVGPRVRVRGAPRAPRRGDARRG